MAAPERVPAVERPLAPSPVWRALLLWTAVAGVLSLHAIRRFDGLTRPEAMEYAQLGRHLAHGKGFRAPVVRPGVASYLGPSAGEPASAEQPDVLHAPAYPALLAAGFLLVRPSFFVRSGQAPFAPEVRVVVPLGLLLTLATAVLIYRMGSRFFSRRVGTLAVSVFAVSEPVLADSVAGLPGPLATLLVTGSLSCALAWARRNGDEDGILSGWWWLAASGVLSGLGILAQYSAAVMVPAIALFVAGMAPRGRLLHAAGWTVLAAAVVVPWGLRNHAVAGAAFGFAPFRLLADSSLFPGQLLERGSGLSWTLSEIMRVIQEKLLDGLSAQGAADAGALAGGWAACLFLASFLHRFVRDDIRLLRWSLALGLVLAAAVGRLYGSDAPLRLFSPVVALYGAAFLFLMVGRLELDDRPLEAAIGGVLVILTAIPSLIGAGPGGRGSETARPPSPQQVAALCERVPADDGIASDMPEAFAWYGNRPALLLPASVKELGGDRAGGPRIGAVHLSARTAARPWTELTSREDLESWLPILNGWIPPKDFPWTDGLRWPGEGGRGHLFLYRPAPPDAARSSSAANEASGSAPSRSAER